MESAAPALNSSAHDLATADYLRATLSGRNPLMLPLIPKSQWLTDHSVLTVPLPVPKGGLKAPGGVDLRPLAELTALHTQQLAGRVWTYEWFYLEQLAIDQKLTPTTWAQPQVITESGLDELEEALLQSKGSYTRASETLADQVRDAWSKNADRWRETGALVEHSGGPWVRRLVFEPQWDTDFDPAPPSQPVQDDGEAEQVQETGLRFSHTPLYAGRRRAEATLYAAARDELFITSIFNVRATAHQEALQWEVRRRRFRLDLRTMTVRRALLTHRNDLALRMYRDGASNGDVAREWIRRGWFPLPVVRAVPEPTPEEPDERDPQTTFESARRVAIRLKQELLDDGKLSPDIKPRRGPGRPRKAD